MKYLMIATLLFLNACTNFKIDAFRLGAVTETLRAKATVQINDGEKFTEKGRGTTHGAAVEFTTETDYGLSVGLLLGHGRGNIEDIDVQTYDVGGVARHYFSENAVRPFFEGRAGFRHVQLDDDNRFGDGHEKMFTLGAGVGLEWRATESFSLFGQVNYNAAFGDDVSSHGPSIMIGGGWTF